MVDLNFKYYLHFHCNLTAAMYKLARYLSHNNLANNKISKVGFYMYLCGLKIVLEVRILMKWISFFFIVKVSHYQILGNASKVSTASTHVFHC